MVNKRNLGVAALATMLLLTTVVGADAALGRTDDPPWQVAPGSLGQATNLAKDWIQPRSTASP